MKLFLILVFIFLGTTSIIFEKINNLQALKMQYSLVHFEKYFVKDKLTFNVQDIINGCSGGPCSYNVFVGYLNSNNVENQVIAPEKYSRVRYKGSIPVWYSKFANSSIYRPDDSLSLYSFREYWFNSFLIFLWFPSLCYFIYLKTNKKWPFLFLVAYLLAFIYLIKIDFYPIKSRMDYFKQHPELLK